MTLQTPAVVRPHFPDSLLVDLAITGPDKTRFMKSFVFFLIFGLSHATSVFAQTDDWQSWPMGEKFLVTVDAFFPTIDTKVTVNATNGTPGTTVDFEQNLGLPETETLPSLTAHWRFAKKHRLQLGYFALKRSGSSVTATQISIGDTVFEVNLPISSFFDVEVTHASYSYSLLFDERKELSLIAGLSVQDVTFGIQGNASQGIIEFDSGITAPLPAFGLAFGYAFTDKWFFRGGVGVFSFAFAVADEDELRGEIVNATASINHQTFKNVRFGLTYMLFEIDAGYGNSAGFNSINYNYHGPALTVGGNF